MATLTSRRSGPIALALTAFAALIIGCGGGGGGGKNNNNNSDGSTNSTSNPSTTSGAAGSIGGGTDGGTGALQANAIYYLTSNPSAGYDVKYTTEDGSVTGTYATGVTQAAAASSPDPSSSSRIVFVAASSTNSSLLGIYRNNAGSGSVSTVGATTIVTPRYSSIDSLLVSRDGTKVVYVASTQADTTPHLYSIATTGSGVPTLLDGDYILGADLSSTGGIVVYEKLPSTGSTELFVRDLSATTPVQFTNDAFDQDEPQFSKDGSKIVFSQDNGTGRHLIGLLSSAGGAITTIDPFPGTTISVRAPSLNAAGTRIAFVAEGDQTTNTGVFTCDLNGANVAQVPNTNAPLPLRSLYWTNTGGRATGRMLHLSRPRPKK